MLISRLHLRFAFAKKKEIIVKNFFTNAQLGKYTSMNDSELETFVEQTKAHKKRWLQVSLKQKEKVMIQFGNQLQSNSDKISNLLSQCTGKQLQQCESQARVAIKIFKKHIDDQFSTPNRFYLNDGKQKDYYDFQPFDHLLGVFDHRYPILSAFKYLGLAQYSGNYAILRPSNIVLPVLKAVKEVWSNVCNKPTFSIIVDPEFDPKHKNSPIPKLLNLTDGFVSFDGRMKDGFDFHYFMTQNSSSFRESEFLLTSSDSAYVMANLSPEELKKSVSIIARGCFSNSGHNFNSIKRVFVDREKGQEFISLLVKQAQIYDPYQSYTEVNTSLIAPFVHKQELNQAIQQLKKLKNNHKDQIKLIAGGQHMQVKTNDKILDFITPAIFQVTADFPNYNYQNEEFMLPICFVSFVDSSSDCIERINSSIFGATASIFTSNATLAGVEPIGKRLDVGTINVNTWEVTDGITYSGRKRSGKGFSFSSLSYNNIVRSKAVSFSN